MPFLSQKKQLWLAIAAAGLVALVAGCGSGKPARNTDPHAQSTPAPRGPQNVAGPTASATATLAASRPGSPVPSLIITGTVLDGDHPAVAGTTVVVATPGEGTQITVCGTGGVGNAPSGSYEVDLPAQLPRPCTGANTPFVFFVHGVNAGGATLSTPDPGRVVEFNIDVPNLPPSDGGFERGQGAPAAVVVFGSASVTDYTGVHAAPDGTVIQVRAGQNGSGPVCGQGTTTSATYVPGAIERGRYRIDIAATPGCFGPNLQYALFVGPQRVATFTASAPPLGHTVDLNLDWSATVGQGQSGSRSQ